MATYDEYYKQVTSSQKDALRRDLEEVRKTKDVQIGQVKDNYQQTIKDTEAAYVDKHRENSIQKMLNVRSIREDMANMGLTDSGLTRSQLTAANLSYANQKGELERDMQSAVNGLKMEMNARMSNIEVNASEKQTEIKDEYDTEARNRATNMYNNYITQQTELATASAEKRDSSYKELYAHLKDNSSDLDYAAKLISEWAYLYNANQKGSEVAALLKQAGLTYNEFMYYTEKGTVYSSVEDYNTYKDELDNIDRTGTETNAKIGRVKWNYNDAGIQRYKFKLNKSTAHVGWVDENDTVDIWYPDGTPLAKNVRIDQLPTRDIQKEATTATNLKKQGAIVEFELDVNLKGLQLFDNNLC